MEKLTLVIISLLIVATACQSQQQESANAEEKSSNEAPAVENTVVDQASEIVQNAIEAHGGSAYDQAGFSFLFRGNKYQFSNNGQNYFYQVIKEKEGETIIDELKNNSFSRMINGQEISLSDKEVFQGRTGLNSVIYFATLPHKLGDKAVNKVYQGSTTIQGKTYEVIEVTFDEEGGGDDHEDTFYYWIDQKTNLVDYLAYNYKVNKGGVRFRTAFDRRIVDGIVFQDYVNYKAEVGTALVDLPELWTDGQLKELSKIITENVQSLN